MNESLSSLFDNVNLSLKINRTLRIPVLDNSINNELNNLKSFIHSNKLNSPKKFHSPKKAKIHYQHIFVNRDLSEYFEPNSICSEMENIPFEYKDNDIELENSFKYHMRSNEFSFVRFNNDKCKILIFNYEI